MLKTTADFPGGNHEPDALSDVMSFVDNIFDSLHSTTAMEKMPATAESSSSRDTRRSLSSTHTMDLGTKHYVPYTTAFQRSKIHEIRELRLKVQQLSYQLTHLRQSHQDSVDNPGVLLQRQATRTSGETWHARAMIEYEQVLRSECTNRKLKEILSEKSKFLDSIRKMLGKHDALEGLDFVERLQPTADRPLFHLDCSDFVFAELSNGLKCLRLEADTVLPRLDDSILAAFRSQNTQHETYGRCFETTVITPMACTVQQAAKMLWINTTNGITKKVEEEYHAREKFPGKIIETNWATRSLFNDNDGALLQADAVIVFRRYEEKNRVVQVGTVSWFVPSQGLRFEDKYWMIVSPSPTDPERSCVIRSCHQLHQKLVGPKISDSPTGNLMMNTIEQGSRHYLQQQQQDFLEQANPVNA